MSDETKQECLLRKPIKSNGETVALMSANGLLLWDKRHKVWEVFKMEDLVKMHEDLVKQARESGQNVMGKRAL